MLARPAARQQYHLRIIWLVHRSVINDQSTCLSLDQWLNFLPRLLTIRWKSLLQDRVDVVR